MAKVFIEETTLTAIGDAIRGKTGKTELIDPANMSTEIAGIEAGGGEGYEPPESAFLITGDCTYFDNNGKWDWFIRDFGHRVTTKDITNCNSMFSSASAEEIPFQINVASSNTRLNSIFAYNENLKVCPKVRGPINCNSTITFESITEGCSRLRDIEDLLTSEMLEGFSQYIVTSAYSIPKPCKVGSRMRSLRKVPSWWYKFRLNPESTAYPSTSNTIYNGAFQEANAIDEVRNIPVWRCQAAQTSNMFSYSFNSCNRLKACTFETNEDGTPIETQWKNQTIELHTYVGWQAYSGSNAAPISYNSGITIDKKVDSAASYQALKNDPDWYACAVEYSRYNHDSAVETINSLPDTSAYLASAGGTNTIKFRNSSGAYTDGGSVNNLTEEEIAVAAAKGWTVSFSTY